jgi:hypothetical protein
MLQLLDGVDFAFALHHARLLLINAVHGVAYIVREIALQTSHQEGPDAEAAWLRPSA